MSKLRIGDVVEVKTFRGRVYDVDDGGMVCIRVRDDLYVWAKEEMVENLSDAREMSEEEARKLLRDEM